MTADLIWEVRENRVELLRNGSMVGAIEPEGLGYRGWVVGDCWPDSEQRVTHGGPWSAAMLMETIVDRLQSMEQADNCGWTEGADGAWGCGWPDYKGEVQYGGDGLPWDWCLIHRTGRACSGAAPTAAAARAAVEAARRADRHG